MRRVTMLMIASFLIVQVLALAIGSKFVSTSVSVVENPGDPANAGFFFGYVLLSAIVLLIVLKFYHGKLLFTFLEFALLFISLQLLLSTFLLDPTSAAFAALVIAAGRFAFPILRSPLLLIASGVVGALLGSSLDILPAVIFSALLAGYDVIAVFYTKHMIALARGLSDRGAAFSIRISDGKAVKQAGGEIGERANKTKSTKAPSSKQQLAGGKEIESIELGTGDLVIPAMLQVSALKLSLLHAGAAFFGGLLGIIALFWVLERQRGYWPALPPIVFGSLAMLAALQALLIMQVVK